jgi:Spy/CpxP family protein refolding chaperone
MKRITKTKTQRIAIAGILGLAMMSLVPVAAQAWNRGGHRDHSPERSVERLTDRLDLTADQQNQVKAILEQDFAKRTEMRKAHREQMETLREQTHKDLAAVLTPEQAEKLNQLQEERQERMEHRGEWGRRSNRCCNGPASDQ